VKDNATANDNIRDAAAGRPAQRSSYGNAPGGKVALQRALLTGILHLTKEYKIGIAEIVGASHSRNSSHYQGNSVDINEINGTHVTIKNPYIKGIIKAAKRLGLKKVIQPPAPGHATHLHFQF
jgi:zinc D-Ala-D-Ala carboxypeptidase